MAPETKVLTAHVPLRLAEKVGAMASRLERSRGWVMKQALAANDKHGPAQRALRFSRRNQPCEVHIIDAQERQKTPSFGPVITP